MDTFRKRAAVIGFRCAVVFQLLEGASPKPSPKGEGLQNGTELPSLQGGAGGRLHHESKASLDFAILIADYALKYQLELFGEQLLQVQTVVASETGYKSRNKRLFDDLPDEFDFNMIQELRPDCNTHALREAVYCWKREKMVVSVGRNQWRKTKS